jgi:hypothetical protein
MRARRRQVEIDWARIPNALATSAIGFRPRPRSGPCGGTSALSRVFPCCAPVVGQHEESNNTTPANRGTTSLVGIAVGTPD